MSETRLDIVFQNLENWMRENNWESHDHTDWNSFPLCVLIKKMESVLPFGKYFTTPFFLMVKNNQNKLRKIFKIKKKGYPQAHSILARAYFFKFQKTNGNKFLTKGIENLQFLKNNAIESEKYFAWGQPYIWFSKKLIPANTPRTTVTTQVIQAFLDGYEHTRNKEFLRIAVNASWFLLKGMNWDIDKDGDYCVSYTPLDNYHIHNANMLASAALIRTWYYAGIDEFYDYGLKSAKFTSKYQNKDGSWYYKAPPDLVKGKIDNIHTGFILESFVILKQYLGEDFYFKKVFSKGVEYYYNNLFKNDYLPKMTPDKTYPIDIQNCAQSIITFTQLNNYFNGLDERVKNIFEWTMKEMYDVQKGFFYYRLYKSGKVDKTPYIRWGQSWMLRAVALLDDS
ncbi:MAG: hypothetical protein ACOC1O_03335 [bacterium]